MNRVLTVMYSHTGTCRRLAQILRAQQKWPLTQVRDLRPRSGVWVACPRNRVRYP